MTARAVKAVATRHKLDCRRYRQWIGRELNPQIVNGACHPIRLRLPTPLPLRLSHSVGLRLSHWLSKNIRHVTAAIRDAAAADSDRLLSSNVFERHASYCALASSSLLGYHC